MLIFSLVKAGGDEELRGLREENERLRSGVPPESTRHLIHGLRYHGHYQDCLLLIVPIIKN